MNKPRTAALWLTRVGWCLTGAALLLAAVGLSPWRSVGGATHPIVDLAQFVVAWSYVVGTPLVAGAALVLERRCRWIMWDNAAVLGLWATVFFGLLFVHA